VLGLPAVESYRSLRHLVMPMAPLNVITGANGSGMTVSFSMLVLLRFCVGGLRKPFDRGEPAVPLRGQVSHGPGGLVEAVCFYLEENLPTLLAPGDQASLFEHGQMFGDGLAGERDVASQPAGADAIVGDEKVEDPATRRVADG
jgi:hypothetical protein